MTHAPSSAPKTVLVSEPQAHRQQPYLPYVWAILKSYCDRHGLDGRVRWLDPIFLRDDPEQLLAPHRDEAPDVLGLSCYTWNWELQCEIARSVKRRHPGCLVVAGGPHPDYKDPAFFKRHPYIDVIVVKDGEIPFRSLLETLLAGSREFGAIPGLYLPGPAAGEPTPTRPAEVPTEFPYSPYIDQAAYYERVVEQLGPGAFDMAWETNRGCPYSCNFCDWGSATMSKVRSFDMARVTAEIDWFSRLRVKGVILVDANFGMLRRDLEIADLLNQARARHGHPTFIHYNPAKNNPDRTLEIARKFAASGISPVYPFAVQHTDPDVLAAADRKNIAVEKQREVARAAVALDIPTAVQLILGIPGDTYDRWKRCLTDLMDWGLHDKYQIFDYALLPNAPAADREFRARWEVDAIRRWVPKEGTGQHRKGDLDALMRVDNVVASKSFDRDDWVQMKIYGAFVEALHCANLTRVVAFYLHFTHGVSYRELYDALIEDYFGRQPIRAKLETRLREFLEDESVVGDLELEEFPDYPMYLDACHWVWIQICLDFHEQFAGIERFLLERFPQATHLASAIAFQRNLVILPSFDRTRDQRFAVDFDWVDYVRRARLLTAYEPLPAPAPTPGAVVEVDAAQALDWSLDDEPTRWRRWLVYTQEACRTWNTTLLTPQRRGSASAHAAG